MRIFALWPAGLLLCGLLLGAPLRASAEALDRIVAVVNEELVLESELYTAMREVLRQLRTQGTTVSD
ncbi:MAG: hypothetical protein L0099_10340, partial [Acidobacteria bacterium]|nr:hypothetical protein [Acidobacteriota bacterium]